MGSADLDEILFQVHLAEKAERYADMLELMRNLAATNNGFESKEQHLFYKACSNCIAPKRLAYQVVSAARRKPEFAAYLSSLRRYKQSIESEIELICADITTILDKYLIPKSKNSETKVFFLTMRADCFRYLSEITSGDCKSKMKESAVMNYKEASEFALTDLSPISLVRLKLALNFSVFLNDVLSDPRRACRLSRAAFDNAISDLSSIAPEDYTNTMLTMQLLRENLVDLEKVE